MDTTQLVLVAIAVCIVPGFLLSLIAGMRPAWALASALPVSFGVFGLAAWLIGQTSARFGLVSVTWIWVAIALLSLSWRLVVRRRPPLPEESPVGGSSSEDAVGGAASGEGRGVGLRSGLRGLWHRRPPAAGRERIGAIARIWFPAPGLDLFGNLVDVTEVTTTVDATAPGAGWLPGLLDPLPRPGEAPSGEGGGRLGGRESAVVAVPPAAAGRSVPAPAPQGVAGRIFDRLRFLLPATGAIAGAWLIIQRSVSFLEDTPGGIRNIFQGWDVQWHANVVRFILDKGVASPTRMGELHNIETATPSYYPTGWHAGAGLIAEVTGAHPIEAVNIASIVIPGLGLPLSVALIAWRAVGNRGLTAQLGAGLGALFVALIPAVYWVGSYVGAWPYVAAVACSGIVAAIFMTTPEQPRNCFIACLSLLGLMQMHPSAVTIPVSILAMWWLFARVWRPAPRLGRRGLAARGREFVVLAVTGLVGTAILLPQILVGSGHTEEVAAFSGVEDLTPGEAWLKAITMSTRHTSEFGELNVWWFWAAAIVGGLVLIFWRRNFWLPLFYLLSVAITANALTPLGEPWEDWLGLLGGLHYNMAHRLVAPVGIATAAAAGIGVAAVARLLCMGAARRARRWSAPLSIVVAVAAGWAGAGNAWSQIYDGAYWSITASRFDDRMVSLVDRRAMQWLARQPHAREGLIMGDPADGHGWMYAYNGLPSVNRHYDWPQVPPESATSILFSWPHLIGQGTVNSPVGYNAADEAAEHLGVNFFYVSPHTFWAEQEENTNMIDRLWHANGITPVYREKNVTIYAVNAAFTDKELAAMRAPGNSPEPLDAIHPLSTKGELGLAEDEDEYDAPFFPRPDPDIDAQPPWSTIDEMDSYLEKVESLDR